MTRDIETLRAWIRIVTAVAAICTTAVPVIYAFSPWYRSRLGQLFMLQAISFAVALDLSLVLSIFARNNILVIFWADAFFLTAIAGSTASLAVLMWKMNHPRVRQEPRKGKHRREDE